MKLTDEHREKLDELTRPIGDDEGRQILKTYREEQENGITHRNDSIRDDIVSRLEDVLTWLNEDGNTESLQVDLRNQRERLIRWWRFLTICEEKEPTAYFGWHTDSRIFGDDHSEVSTTIAWKCCANCTMVAWEFHVYMERLNRAIVGMTDTHPQYGELSKVTITKVDKCPECRSEHLEYASNKTLGMFRICMDCTLQIRKDDEVKYTEKIIKYRARTYTESLDSDEMRINPEWLS